MFIILFVILLLFIIYYFYFYRPGLCIFVYFQYFSDVFFALLKVSFFFPLFFLAFQHLGKSLLTKISLFSSLADPREGRLGLRETIRGRFGITSGSEATSQPTKSRNLLASGPFRANFFLESIETVQGIDWEDRVADSGHSLPSRRKIATRYFFSHTWNLVCSASIGGSFIVSYGIH